MLQQTGDRMQRQIEHDAHRSERPRPEPEHPGSQSREDRQTPAQQAGLLAQAIACVRPSQRREHETECAIDGTQAVRLISVQRNENGKCLTLQWPDASMPLQRRVRGGISPPSLFTRHCRAPCAEVKIPRFPQNARNKKSGWAKRADFWPTGMYDDWLTHESILLKRVA